MPSPLRQLALIIQFGIRNLARVPAAVLFVTEHSRPKTLQVMTCLGVDALHLPQEHLFQHSLVEFLWMLVDGLTCYREDCAGLKANRLRGPIVTKVVEEVLEVLGRRLWGLFALEYAFWRRPFRPAWVLLPRNAVPKVEKLHDTMRKGGDSPWSGLEGNFLHLKCREIGMIVDAALGEKSDVLEVLVMVNNVVKVGVAFTANVLKGLDFERKLGRVLRATFSVYLAVFDDRLEPGEVFIVMRDDDLTFQRIPCCGRRISSQGKRGDR